MDPITLSALLAGGGALLGGLGSLFGTKKEEYKQVPRFTPEQASAQSALLQEALAGLRSPDGGAYSFSPIEQQARSQFQQRTIPSIAERFASADAQRGSAFQQQLGQAGAGLEENLAALRSQYNLNRLGQLSNLFSLGLQPQFETAYKPESQTGFGRFASTAGSGLMSAGLGGLSGLFGQAPMSMPTSSFTSPLSSQEKERMNTIADFIKGKQSFTGLGSMFGNPLSGSPFMYNPMGRMF